MYIQLQLTIDQRRISREPGENERIESQDDRVVQVKEYATEQKYPSPRPTDDKEQRKRQLPEHPSPVHTVHQAGMSVHNKRDRRRDKEGIPIDPGQSEAAPESLQEQYERFR